MTSQQEPIASPFTPASTAMDVIAGINLKGKTAVVTGGYSGVGLETVRALLSVGSKVIVPTRDREKAKKTMADLPDAILGDLDLLSQASIDAFAEWFLKNNDKLDILINSAGIMAAPLARDVRGYESQFATNVLGHFQLTARLWPALVSSGSARVVAVASANHRANVSDILHDPNFETGAYEPWKAYAQSKAGNILFAVALDGIGKKSGVRAFAIHPGAILETGLAKHMDMSIAKQYGMIDDEGNAVIDPNKDWKTPQQGAATQVWAATSPMLDGRGGLFLASSNIAALDPSDADGNALTPNTVAPSVVDPINAGRLWQLAEELTGARID